MTLETAEKLVQFLNKKRSNNNPVHIQWFGGEPLLNKGVIDYIIDRLIELNISYVCGITTNGFLLNEDVVNSFKRWNLTTMQITLDGLNDEYNSIKNYIYSDIDAFMIVVNNIHNVLEKTETIVTLRFNVSNDNIFSMYDTIEYLKEEFKEHYNKKIFFYVSPLFEYLKPDINIVDGFWEEFNRISTIVKTSKLNKCETLLETGIFSRDKINKNCFA